MVNYRWNPYVLLSDSELDESIKVHFTGASRVLLIMSRGFDVRMNVALEKLLTFSPGLNVKCLVIQFDEGEGSASLEYLPQVENNMAELYTLVEEKDIIIAQINLWHSDGQSKRRIGDRRAAAIIDGIKLTDYSDIIVDISALPKGIYFSLIGKLLTVIDLMKDGKPNLMVTVAENPVLDKTFKDDTPDDEPGFLQGFTGQIDNASSNSEDPLIWMPILGEDKEYHIRKAYSFLAPSETCPILPFPSRDARRPDALIVSYHSLLFDEFIVEQQNIMYVPEQNPFEAYRILMKAIYNYYDSLNPIGNSKVVLSTFSSKLLSIGTLLAAYELKAKDIEVGVLNVDSQGYKFQGGQDLEKMKRESNLFLIWLIGDAYEK